MGDGELVCSVCRGNDEHGGTEGPGIDVENGAQIRVRLEDLPWEDVTMDVAGKPRHDLSDDEKMAKEKMMGGHRLDAVSFCADILERIDEHRPRRKYGTYQAILLHALESGTDGNQT